MNDPIGDFLIRIRNANNVGKESVLVPFSKVKLAIAELLSTKGYLGTVSKKTRNDRLFLEAVLLYRENQPAISGVQRISKPSRRIYESAKNIKRFRRGFGLSVFSTSRGIMADADAKKNNLGGEFMFNIW